jgi:SAM-dependent methyltransferase
MSVDDLRSGGTAVGGYDADLFDQLAAAEERSFWFRARNRLLVELVSQVAGPGDRLLEIGCGTGYVLQALVGKCRLRATGGELLAEGLEHARRRVPGAEFAEVDALAMPYDREFDLVGAFDVLEHIEDDLKAIRGLHRAVRSGGHVLLTVPQHPWLWSAFDEHSRHVRRYRRAELVERVTQAGLTPVRVTSFVTSLLPLMALSRMRQRRSRRAYDPIAELLLPAPIDRVLEMALDSERRLIRWGVNLPVGGSLVLLARRDLG